MSRKPFLSLFASVVLTLAASAQTLPSGVQKKASVGGITNTRTAVSIVKAGDYKAAGVYQ